MHIACRTGSAVPCSYWLRCRRSNRLGLAALPSLQLRIRPAPVLRKVDKLSCARIGSARYSVPMALIGTSMQVVSGSGRVLIVDSRTGEVMADQARSPRCVLRGRRALRRDPAEDASGDRTGNLCGESVLRPWRLRGVVPGRCRRGRAHPLGA